jgi:allantoin racemase
VDPTGAAVLWLESSVRLGVRPSRTTYMPPPAKARVP